MLNTSFSFVLASLRRSTYGTPSTPRLRSLRPCWKAVLNLLQAMLSLIVVPNGHAQIPIVCRQSARRMPADRIGSRKHVIRKRTRIGWYSVALLLLMQACSSPPNVSSKVVVSPLPPPKTVGSLWQEENGRAYLYEDLRAMRIGDILTVKISENHKGSKSADTAAQRDSTIKNSLIGSAMGYIGIPGIRFSDETRRGMGIDASASNKFGGKGATNREGTLTGTISAIVTEVLPNGDLRIEGRREVSVNSEKQLMSIGGIVRRVDVDTKNTVASSAIADARIEYSGLGVLDDVQRPGWFIRILDWVYPF